MTVETATKVSQLNIALPASGDSKSEGDDHIRVIKVAVLGTLSGADTTGVTGFNVATQTLGNSSTLSASTAFVANAISAPLPSPSITGTALLVNQETSGTATFAGVTINGTLDMNAGTPSTITGLATPSGSTDAATKGYVDTQISNLIAAAPGTLDTLDELAAALGDDANFAATTAASIATKLPLAGGTMSGPINMGSQKITALAAPTAGGDAVNLTHVETLYGSTASAASSASTATTQAGIATTAAGTATTQAGNANSSAIAAAASAAVAASAAAFIDTNPVVKGSADATKQMRFEVDGLTTATTRVITVPNADITIAAAGANSDITSLSAIALGSAALPSYSFTGDPNTGAWSPAADTWAVSTGGVKRLQASSSGIDIVGSITNRPATDKNLWLRDNAGLSISALNDAVNAYVPLTIDTSSLTVNGGLLTLSQGQIAFPAVQVPSGGVNTLDDYEEGTSPISLITTGTQPTTPINSTCRYTKIGRLVSVEILFSNVDTTGATGSMQITGMPFAANSVLPQHGIVILANLGSIAGALQMGTSSSTVNIVNAATGTGMAVVAGAGKYVYGQITYTV